MNCRINVALSSFVFALLLSSAGYSQDDDTNSNTRYEVRQNIVYSERDGIGLLMDIFTPADPATPNGLGIVQVVSGSWYSDRGKIRDLNRARVFETFCAHGYTVFAIRPGSVSKFSAPEMVSNVETGIRWVKERNADFAIAPNRLGLMGASAGGHIGSLVALKNAGGEDPAHDASIAAAGIFFSPTDFQNYAGRAIDVRESGKMESLLRHLAFTDGSIDGLTEQEIVAAVGAISPAKRVTEDGPPFLLFHGTADLVVPIQQSRTFMEALIAKGVPAELVVKKGGGHPWPTIHEEISQLAAWFDEQLKVRTSK